MTAIPRVLTSRSVLSNLGRFESLLPVANSKIGKVAKPVKFAKSGSSHAFIFEGGIVSSPRKAPFWVETSMRK
eukprot:CCRYP_016322-RA/>CCRYP_016322-RA protein AED:0.00 eAED:0.00 QI:154/1/1/1/0/0/3/3062/72